MNLNLGEYLPEFEEEPGIDWLNALVWSMALLFSLAVNCVVFWGLWQLGRWLLGR